ncbi:MAG: TonB-dependent receptor plug domain-containing protein, partial [Gammaproteobacteria bacterium]|nr:TonB-dependent receptor plug domain-containing protein [Gammaproteobacteria bacterium]
MQCKTRLSLTISAALGFSTLLAVPALAQEDQSEFDDESTIEEVIITGSRIVSDDGFGRTSPVTVVDMGEISSFGFTRVEDILNNLPQVEADQSSMIANGSSGTASINLRGLGAKRTLVLINGRRMQPGGVYSQEPDINQIPAQMIERVEVLTGGASATYGADAVAGVVNFIMRRVDGVEISAGIDGYQHNNNNSYIQGLMDERGFEYPTGNTGIDGKGYNVNFVIGGDFENGRGNATAYINWRKNDELLQESRDYSSCALNWEGTVCGGSPNTEVPNYFMAPLTEDGLGPHGFDFFQQAWLALQPDNSLLPYDRANSYNYAPINHFMRPDERWSLGAFADYEFNRHAEVYLELMGFNDETRAQIAESGTFFAEVYPLPLSNEYFPENFRKSLEQYWPGEDEFGFYIGKRNV